MANDEYHIPEAFEAPFQKVEHDVVQDSPEQQPEPYHRLKENERIVYTSRQAVLEDQVTKKGPMSAFGFLSQKETERSLIDKESIITGRRFGPGQKFWLDVAVSDAATHGFRDTANWYHLRQDPNNPKNSIVLRYETTPYKIHKIYEGKEVAQISQAEIDHFLEVVELYVNDVSTLHATLR